MDAAVTPMESYLRRKGPHYRDQHIRQSKRRSHTLTSNFPTPPSSLFGEVENRKPSRAPFASLSQVALRNINTNQVAARQFLLLRTLEPPCMVGNCVINVVEDHLGLIIFLQLHNYIVTKDELDDYFPIGTIMIIKEPFCELVNDSIAIRVDHPTDVVVIRSCDELYQSYSSIKWENEIDESKNPLLANPKPSNAEEWKKRGNKLFKVEKYYSAEVAYKLCINEANKSQDETVKNLAMRNLIFVYLKLEQFDEAVEMAERVLEHHPDDSKALFRLGCAYYELREYSKAVKYLEMVYQVEPNDASINRELHRARLRLQEQSTGNYDIEHLYQQSNESIEDTDKQKLFDVADYVGVVEIKTIDGKSVGVVATEDIEPGTLLAVSKAFQVCFSNEHLTSYDLEDVNADVVGVEALRLSSAVCTAVHKNFKTFGKQIYQLLPPPVESSHCDPQTLQELVFDATEIVNLAFTKSRRILNFSSDDWSSGFFTFPSHIRHSCLPNCSNITYNNVMIIRALWPINKGEEITISHIHPYRPGLEDRRVLLQRFGYACNCLLCDLDGHDDDTCRSLRKEYFSSMKTTIASATTVEFCNASSIEELNKHIDDMLSTYNERTSFQTEMYSAYLALATCFLKTSNYEATRENVLKAFNCLGFHLDNLKKLASFAEGHNSAALELKGKVYVGMEFVLLLVLLTHALTNESLLLQHFAEAEMVVTLTNYLKKVVFGDTNVEFSDIDQLDDLIRRHKS